MNDTYKAILSVFSELDPDQIIDTKVPNPIFIKRGTRADLVQVFQLLGLQNIAEIGVHLGGFSRYILDHVPTIKKMYCIDTWHRAGVFEQAKKQLAGFPSVEFMNMESMKAVKHFRRFSLDGVYIDANHRFKWVAEDVTEWPPTVKPGGIVSGHDYHDLRPDICHVIQAIDGYTSAYNIRRWFVLAGDKAASWFWVKEND